MTTIVSPGRPVNEVSTLLPVPARMALMHAAAVPDPFKRAIAIDHASDRARMQYPQMFRTPTQS